MSKFMVSVFVLFLGIQPLHSEVRRVEPEAFLPSGVQIMIGDDRQWTPLAAEGSIASHLLDGWNVFLQSACSTAEPSIAVRKPGWFPHPDPSDPELVYYVKNTACPGNSSSNVPLIVVLARPATRVGLFLVIDPSLSVTASLEAFGLDGRSLGITEEMLAPPARSGRRFVGIEAVGALIERVIIDYGPSPTPESLDGIMLDFADPPVQFETFVPQLGAGEVPASVLGQGTTLQSSLTLLNVTNASVAGTIETRDSDGRTIALFGEGSASATQSFSLTAFGQKTWKTNYAGTPPLVGYAKITSSGPVKGSVLYSVAGSVEPIRAPLEAGILSDNPKNTVVVPVEKVGALEVGTGIALVNTTPSEAKVEFNFEQAGTGDSHQATRILAGGQHLAVFVDSLLGLAEDFRGNLVVRSNQPIAVTLLRTWKGLCISSLSVGSLEK